MSIDSCQKCKRPIGADQARWMFSPVTGLRLDKCQGCGPWTLGEKQFVEQYLKHMQPPTGQRAGGCGCTGKR